MPFGKPGSLLAAIQSNAHNSAWYTFLWGRSHARAPSPNQLSYRYSVLHTAPPNTACRLACNLPMSFLHYPDEVCHGKLPRNYLNFYTLMPPINPHKFIANLKALAPCLRGTPRSLYHFTTTSSSHCDGLTARRLVAAPHFNSTTPALTQLQVYFKGRLPQYFPAV